MQQASGRSRWAAAALALQSGRGAAAAVHNRGLRGRPFLILGVHWVHMRVTSSRNVCMHAARLFNAAIPPCLLFLE